jgi:hypothetical protein
MYLTIFLKTYASAVAANCPSALAGSSINSVCSTGLHNVGATKSQLNTFLATIFGILGVVAVVLLVVGGIQFMTSGGNSEQTNKARNTILYALIGLAVAVCAELIVAFVLDRIKGL